jgi:autotransporter strand-loop-strand O-heptosyltransferase
MDDSNFYASYKVQYGFSNDDNLNLNKLLEKNSRIGYIPGISFWNKNESPYHPNLKPLAEFGSSVLGLDYIERRPIFEQINNERPIEKKYICISEFASGVEKQWNNKIGWQTLVDELKRLGYEVVSISKEKSNLKNVTKRNGDFDLEDRIWYLQHCEFFIGVSSGLSWLAWASGKKVVIISGITVKNNEFYEDCIRIINETVCHGCWNLEEHCDKFVFRRAPLCPENKNFTCSRSISPKMVIDEIKKHLVL